jgi:hypothetical protein
MSRWTTVSIYDVRDMPVTAVVYAIYIRDRERYSAPWRLIYVGSTGNMRARMSGHRSSGKVGTHCNPPDRDSEWLVWVKYSENRRYGENLMREARLLRRLSPIYNERGCTKQDVLCQNG